MTLQQLRYFLAAIRHGTLSAAAEACHIAQPSLSEQIRSLERELGVELFVRTTRGLILTDAAVELQPHAEATLASAEEARAAVRGVRDLEGGTVRFGTFSSALHPRRVAHALPVRLPEGPSADPRAQLRRDRGRRA
jgi:LysR family transcriptional regulator, cyn operon transcriptional activator